MAKEPRNKKTNIGPADAPWNQEGTTAPREPEQVAPREPQVTTKVGTAAVVKSFRDFNMRKQLETNPTTHYPFVYPGAGDTGYWLKIRSQHSPEFREADLKAQRQISSMYLAAGGKPETVDQELVKDITLRAFTKLVAEWNFPDELTEDNLVEFLTDNPFAYDDINSLAAQDSLFFSKTANA